MFHTKSPKRYTSCLLLLLIPCFYTALPGNPVAAQSKQATNNTSLNGAFYAHDLYELFSDRQQLGRGFRTFNNNGVMNRLFTYPNSTPLNYEVASDATFRLFTSGFNAGFAGTIGLGGQLAVFTHEAAPNEDAQVRDGYASLQISVKQSNGRRDRDFDGNYSYHGLIRTSNGTYQTSFGLAESEGDGEYVLIREDRVVRTYAYDVASDGSVDLGRQGSGSAAIMAGGGLLVNTAELGNGDDPEIPGGYSGLALYLRRFPNNTAATTHFRGTYRIHRIAANGTANPAADVGSVTAGGNGYFFGDVGGQPYTGQIALNGSGTFTLMDSNAFQGTLGENGGIAVITSTPGTLPTLEIWVRTAGGPGNALDSDGDGLTNAEEALLGTSASNPDTDGDGLLDNADDRPLIADNLFSATLSETNITAEVGGPAITNVTLALDSNDFPFFEWELSTTAPWLTITPASGFGDEIANLKIDIPSLTADNSPHTATINVDAPVMRPQAPVTLTVTIASPQVDLALNPNALTFTLTEGGPVTNADIALTSPDGNTFSWQTETTFPWITATPASGSGPATVTLEVDPATLTADASPHIGTIVFKPDGTGPKQFPVTITAVVVPERDVGIPFPINASNSTQSRPAMAFDESTETWTVAWVEAQQIMAALFDANLVPRTSAQRLSISALGPATNPSVVAVEDEDEAWIVWEQRPETGGDGTIRARIFDLQTRTTGGVFGFTTGAGDKTEPHAVYNQAANHVAITFAQSFGTDTFLGLVRLDASTGNELSSGFAAPSDNRQTFPALDWLADTNHYLIAWREDIIGDETTTTQVRAQRLAGNTGMADGPVIVVSASAAGASNIRISAIRSQNRWILLYTDISKSLHTVTVNADGSTGTMFTIDAEHRTGTPIAMGYNAESRQSLMAWTRETGDENRAAVYRTIAGNGQPLGGQTPFPGNPAGASSLAVGANAVANEFLLVWEDPNTIPRQLTAVRLAGGSTDVDGDGLPNEWELQYGLDPGSAEGDDGALGDPDRDGLTNAAEFLLGTDPTNPDSDGDGLLDGQEDRNSDGILEGRETSPLLADSDGDGVTDDVEWFLGSDGTDSESTPETAIYRVDYGAWTPGVTGTLTVSFYVDTAGLYALQVNPDASTKQAAPVGWSIAAEDDGSLQPYEPGAYTLAYTITPSEDLTPSTAYGLFHFVLRDDQETRSTNSAVLVADLLQAYTGTDNMSAESLAQAYAPVLRLHRDALFTPIPVGVSLDAAALDIGNTMRLTSAPMEIDLFQSPNRDAYIDLPGTDVEALFEAYPPPEDRPDPALYYTVTSLGDNSEEPGADPTHISIQYYFHFFADLWGLDQTGGHRHEGDWEVFQVLLDANRNPYRATATQQWQLAPVDGTPGGESRPWDRVEADGENRPVLYAGQGGHSLYFEPGTTHHTSAAEVHDGLGYWLLPAETDTPLVIADYDRQLPLHLRPLTRLSDENPTRWLRFAGTWGQPNYPIPEEDDALHRVNDGPVGPAFMGTTTDPANTDGVQRIWSDPHAFAARMPERPEVPTTKIRGIVDAETLWDKTLMLFDARGRIYTSTILAGNGAVDMEVPRQTYLLSVVEFDDQERPVPLATGLFLSGSRRTPLLPTREDITPIGILSLNGRFLVGDASYPFTDTDGDGIVDLDDDDMDGDGIPNGEDADKLGDGFADQFQAQDPDGDGIPNFLDDDDDGDGIPDADDPDRNGNGIPDVDEPADTDGDGFIDALDLDIDNDGFDNTTEIDAGSDPYHYLDTPLQRVGDVNNDGVINTVDGQQMVNMGLGRAPYTPRADYDLNGTIDAIDLQSLVNDILQTSP